jgi:hypothetical protein
MVALIVGESVTFDSFSLASMGVAHELQLLKLAFSSSFFA